MSTHNDEAITTIKTWEKMLGALLPLAVTIVGVACTLIWNRMDSLEEKFGGVQSELSSIRERQITKEELKELQINILDGVEYKVRLATMQAKLEQYERSARQKEIREDQQ